MSIHELDTAIDVVVKALGRLERKIAKNACRATKTALLQQAPPEMIFPTPAIGLMTFTSEGEMRMLEDVYLRSVDPLLMDGEAVFTTIAERVLVHPWHVEEAVWLIGQGTDGVLDDHENDIIRGFRVTLKRKTNGAIDSGWINLHVAGDAAVREALAKTRCLCQGKTIPSRIWTLEANEPPGGHIEDRTVRGAINGLGRNILQIQLIRSLQQESVIELVGLFPEAITMDGIGEPCRLIANVHPVWNSRRVKYPSSEAIEQSVSGTIHHRIHPLGAPDNYSRWRLWRLEAVRGSAGSRIDPAPALGEAGLKSGPFYHLALVSIESKNAVNDPLASRPMTPAIVLDEEAVERLSASDERLSVRYLVTQGNGANGLPPGSEFTAAVTATATSASRIKAKLVGTTWLGTAGLIAEVDGTDEMDSLLAICRLRREMKISDLVSLVDYYFGHAIELVDPRDFLAITAGPVNVRYRYRRDHFEASSRAAIHAALNSFLIQRLSDRFPQGIHLVAVSREDGNAAQY